MIRLTLSWRHTVGMKTFNSNLISDWTCFRERLCKQSRQLPKWFTRACLFYVNCPIVIRKSSVICFPCSYGSCDQHGPGVDGNGELHPSEWASSQCSEANSGAGQRSGHLTQREAPCQGYGALFTWVRCRECTQNRGMDKTVVIQRPVVTKCPLWSWNSWSQETCIGVW